MGRNGHQSVVSGQDLSVDKKMVELVLLVGKHEISPVSCHRPCGASSQAQEL
jgi:hypothetical protein